MGNHRDPTNYYEILEVPQDAPQPEVHKAYLRAKATYASDNPALYSMFSKEETRELIRLIEEAYSVLGNQGARRNYDENRAAAKGIAENMNMAPPTPSAESIAESFAITPNHSQTSPAAHAALPDFAIPEPKNNDLGHAYRNNTKETPVKSSIEPGMGRTHISTYKIDDMFEEEIAAQIDFDGAFIQKIRLYKNVSLDKVSDATRISRTYLMAVEANEYRVLPAGVFVRGFVVQIARMLNLDEKKVATSYMKLFNAGREKK